MSDEPQYQHLLILANKKYKGLSQHLSRDKFKDVKLKSIADIIRSANIDVKRNILKVIYNYAKKHGENGMYPYGMEWSNINKQDIIDIELKNIPAELIAMIEVYVLALNSTDE